MIAISLVFFSVPAAMCLGQYAVKFVNMTGKPLFIKYDHRPNAKPGQMSTMEIISVPMPKAIEVGASYILYMNPNRRISDIYASVTASGPYQDLDIRTSSRTTYEISEGHNGFAARQAEE